MLSNLIDKKHNTQEKARTRNNRTKEKSQQEQQDKYVRKSASAAIFPRNEQKRAHSDTRQGVARIFASPRWREDNQARGKMQQIRNTHSRQAIGKAPITQQPIHTNRRD